MVGDKESTDHEHNILRVPKVPALSAMSVDLTNGAFRLSPRLSDSARAILRRELEGFHVVANGARITGEGKHDDVVMALLSAHYVASRPRRGFTMSYVKWR